MSARGLRTVSVFFAVIVFAAGLIPDWSRVEVQDDSASYLQGLSFRPLVYPTFLRLTLPADVRRGPLDSTGNTYRRAIEAQKILVIGAVAGLVWVLSLFHPLAGPALLLSTWGFGALMGVPQITFLRHSLSWLMTEGLIPTWVTLTYALSVLAWLGRRRWAFIALGPTMFLGLELAPRLVFFLPLACVVWAAGFWRDRRGWALLLGPCLLVGALAGRCALTYHRYGVFATVPYEGVTTIGVALALLEPHDLDRFTDPAERAFLTSALQGERRRSGNEAINWNAWRAAPLHYARAGLRGGLVAQNRFYSAVARRLLFSRTGLFRWALWTAHALWPHVTQYWRTLGVVALFLLAPLLLGGEGTLLPFVAALVHLINLGMTTALTGVHGRYLLTSGLCLAPAGVGLLYEAWRRWGCRFLSTIPHAMMTKAINRIE